MNYHNEKQGTNQWLKLRLQSFTASEAAAMLGMSSYMTRTELLTLKKTGVAKEVDAMNQKRFDKGHQVEELARPIIERLIEDELYPVVGSIDIDGMKILASFDGITLMEDIIFEHKLLNAKLRKSISEWIIPEQYHPQLEQQLMVSGADKAIFVASDGTEENLYHVEYTSNADLKEKIIAGWKQFAIDLESFEVIPEIVKPETAQIMELPSLFVQINGEVSNSNLEIYKESAIKFITNINTELTEDTHFAQAEVDIKFCANAEKELESVKKQALSQTNDIDLLFKTIDHLSGQLRQKRLTLNKLVKNQKDNIKMSMVSDAQQLITKYINDINATLNGMLLPATSAQFADFPNAIKGKRNISSMRDAIDTEISRVKIEIRKMAMVISENLNTYATKAVDYQFLFSDLQSIINKQPDDFALIIDSRINEHIEKEEIRIQAEQIRIRKEEHAKAEQDISNQKNIKQESNGQLRRALDKAESNKIRSVRAVEKVLSNDLVNEDIKKYETITIPKLEYEQLLERSKFLLALEQSGVDNWVGYENAIELIEYEDAVFFNDDAILKTTSCKL